MTIGNVHDLSESHTGLFDSALVIDGSISGYLSGTNLHDVLEGIASGASNSGSRVSVSSADTTSDFLGTKLVAGTGISLAIINAGGNETLRVTNTGSGGGGSGLMLGGVAGSAHIGTGGAVSAATVAAESTHQHPAQVLLRGSTVGINTQVVGLRASGLAADQVIIAYDSSGLPYVGLMQNSGNGVRLYGPAATATGDDRYTLTFEGQGNSGDAILVLAGSGSSILRAGTDPVLFESDIGVTVQPYSVFGDTSVATLSDATSTSTTMANVTDLELPVGVPAGNGLAFRALIRFQTAATTTGIKLGLHGPGMTYIAFTVRTPTSISASDTGNFHGIAQVLTTAGIDAANTDYLAVIEGVCAPSGSGSLGVMFATEVAASAVKVMAGSSLTITSLPA